jgi:mutator protein MutT
MAPFSKRAVEDAGPLLQVVVGVVMDRLGRVLLAQRPAGKHLAGAWEFPGGKLEPGEHPLVGLARELKEEVGIGIAEPRPLMRVKHSYPYGTVLLNVWLIRKYVGDPIGLDGQALRWCEQDELGGAALVAADAPIVAALRLPDRMTQISSPFYVVRDSVRQLVTQGQASRGASILVGVVCSTAAEAVDAADRGAHFLLTRTLLADYELRALCRSVMVPVYARGSALEEVWNMGATGLNQID